VRRGDGMNDGVDGQSCTAFNIRSHRGGRFIFSTTTASGGFTRLSHAMPSTNVHLDAAEVSTRC
jgi:hypothetical protein